MDVSVDLHWLADHQTFRQMVGVSLDQRGLHYILLYHPAVCQSA